MRHVDANAVIRHFGEALPLLLYFCRDHTSAPPITALPRVIAPGYATKIFLSAARR